MTNLTVESTSANSAVCSPVVLRDLTTIRLVFIPQIINNPNDTTACVRGEFVYQRKGPNDVWDDIRGCDLSGLKKGQGYHLLLRSAEVALLMERLEALRKIFLKDGIPSGKETYVTQSALQHLVTMAPRDLAHLAQSDAEAGKTLLVRLLQWAAKVPDFGDVLRQLEQNDPSALKYLSLTTGVRSLSTALRQWKDNKDNDVEDFWQKFFARRFFLLEQLFPFPIVLIQERAYVGGKRIDNTGSALVDYIAKNALTNNAVLIEIKTPCTRLLGSRYREGVYPISQALSGAVQQVLRYRNRLYQSGFPNPETHAPTCVVIAGDTSVEFGKTADCDEDNEARRASFELYRAHLHGVGVFAYDEIFARLRGILSILKERAKE